MGYLPNVAAAEFLVNEVLPGTSCTAVIAGARPDTRVLSLASDLVTVTGWVDDIRESYADVCIFVAPLFNGTGQQNKILEAMAMGIPVVTTRAVNEAIGAEDGVEIVLAESADDFRKAIQDLLTDDDLIKRISASARSMVINKYSWQQQTAPLIDLLL
jgi:glycosyltransferase involved in cell wall biosynthesis